MKGPGPRLARVLGGGLGGLVAGYFAVASGELIPPATVQWAYGGGTFALLFALPTAALVGGVIGLLGGVSHSSGIVNPTTSNGRPADKGGVDRS
jgi:hypothetical protein